MLPNCAGHEGGFSLRELTGLGWPCSPALAPPPPCTLSRLLAAVGVLPSQGGGTAEQPASICLEE